MRKFRAAVVGCGVAGSLVDAKGPTPLPQSHAGMYASDPRFELVAACDSDVGRLRAFETTWKPRHVCRDIAEMFERTGPRELDVVSISTPTDTHAELLNAVLESSVSVVVLEKPVARSVREADPLRGQLSNKRTKVLVNYQRRWSTNFIRLVQHVRESRLGEIVRAQINYPIGIVHSGSHGIDLLRWMFGPPQWVQALNALESGVSDGVVDCALGWAGGLRAYLQGFARRPWNIFELDLLGTAGRVRVTNGGRDMEFYAVDVDRDYPHLRGFVPVEAPFPNEWQSAYLNLADHVVELLERPERQPRCSFSDGYEALRVAEAAVVSAHENSRRIDL